MEMHFSAGVVFIWGWFGGNSWTRGWFDSDALFSFVSGEVTPNSFTQWETFKNRNVPCTRPSQGEAWALICCPPAGAQAVSVFLWLLSSSQTWHVVFGCREPRVALQVMLELWEEKEWQREFVWQGKASVFSFAFSLSLPCGTCAHKYLHVWCGINKARFCFCLRRAQLIQIGFILESG